MFCGSCGEKVERETVKEFQDETRQSMDENFFDLKNYLEKVKKRGILKSKADKIEVKKWNPKEYIEEIFQSIIHGGFSYFLYKGEARELEFREGTILPEDKKMMVREKEPLLMTDENLLKVADIKRQGSTREEGERWGLLYYTGRRFIFDITEFNIMVSQFQEAEYSLPLISYWIEPDFTDILEATNTRTVFEDGILRKKSYDFLSFEVVEVKKPRFLGDLAVKCGYMLRGSGGEDLYDFYHYWSDVGGGSADELAERLTEMVSSARGTPVSDLIKHTLDCQGVEDSMIDNSITIMSRDLTDYPYTLLGYYSRFI